MFEKLPCHSMALDDAIAHMEARLADLDDAIAHMEAYREALRTAVEFMTVRFDEDDGK
jgi:hypothetical protein